MNKLNWLNLLTDLVALPGLSGHEELVAKFMRASLEDFADEVSIDRMGNVIATLRSSDKKAPHVMVFAHMDQLGFVVQKVDDGGFLRLERLGGVPDKVLPGTHVTVVTPEKSISGVIGSKSHHVTPQDEKFTVTPYSQLFVDIGTESREATLALGVNVGSPISYKGALQVLQSKYILAPALDNRAGCAIIVQLAQRLASARPRATIHLVATVQEEFNLRGAVLAARALKPDIAICLDIAIASDTPDLAGRYDIALGQGPVMSLYNFHGRGTLNGTIPPKRFTSFVQNVAVEASIPLQRGAATGILTDASYVQLEGHGIATIDLGFPLRYSHSPSEMCHLDDLENLTSLLEKLLSVVEPDMVLDRRL